MKSIVVCFVLMAPVFGQAESQPIQPVQSADPCVVSKDMSKNQKKLIELRCKLELEKAQLEQTKVQLEQKKLDKEMRDLKNVPGSDLIAPGPVGAVAGNKSVITITERTEEGISGNGTKVQSREASKGWAEHEEEMKKLDVKIAKANNHICGFFEQCYPPYGYGYYGGYTPTYTTTTTITTRTTRRIGGSRGGSGNYGTHPPDYHTTPPRH